MKLVYTPASPFARKARILVHEMQLADKIECVNYGLVSPVTNNETVFSLNPLGFIPVLILDDGQTLYDSPVICEYLDLIGKGEFFPQDQEKRFLALKLQALADGLLDTAVSLRYEVTIRTREMQSPEWIESQTARMKRVLHEFDSLLPTFTQRPTIGEITIACALGYLDFRFAELEWRDDHPALSGWFEAFRNRESLRQTEPTG